MTDGLNNQDSKNSGEGGKILEGLATLAGIVILAGGASSRMGSAKAQLTLPTNENLLDYHVRQGIKLNVPIMIADNGRGFPVDKMLLANHPESTIFHIADYGATTKFSGHDTGGALVAIESALQTLLAITGSNTLKPQSSLWLLVISCDSLIPVEELWQRLRAFIAKASDKSVICLSDETHLYPLLGLYQLSVEPKLRVYIDNGERRVMRFIEPIMQPVPILESWQGLTNFNTPDEFKRACMALYQSNN